MPQYEFKMKCVVDKLVMVEAKDETEAMMKANACDWSDEIETGQRDWEIEDGPTEI